MNNKLTLLFFLFILFSTTNAQTIYVFNAMLDGKIVKTKELHLKNKHKIDFTKMQFHKIPNRELRKVSLIWLDHKRLFRKPLLELDKTLYNKNKLLANNVIDTLISISEVHNTLITIKDSSNFFIRRCGPRKPICSIQKIQDGVVLWEYYFPYLQGTELEKYSLTELTNWHELYQLGMYRKRINKDFKFEIKYTFRNQVFTSLALQYWDLKKR